MIKRNKGKIIITSLIILIPVIAGLIIWNRLPDQVPVHWNAAGEIDGYAGKAMAVIAMPLFMLLVHLICIAATALDPKNKNISGKPLGIVLWICPLMSLIVTFMIYSTAMGAKINVNIVISLLLGAVFIVIGNYLPKCRPNYTIGIRIPWTLHDEGNWVSTHRFAGPVWVAGGILTMLAALITKPAANVALIIGSMLLIIIIPIVYSFLYYKRNS